MREKYPNAKLIVTGHSLGAAISIICLAEFASTGIHVDEFYNFGGPRVGDPEFASWLNRKYPGKKYRVTHNADPAPHLPF